ncbi:MAG: tRNA lysidine(34) synthetase TilS [Dehalococcoidia bacterium]|nr:tRNA lysidine(34) synthetase TilS [Dehalococcoidia bacterium]
MMAETGPADPRAPAAPPHRDAHDTLPRNRLTAAFERRIAAVLDRHIEAGARLVVACSGGPDSTATLVAVTRARSASRVTAACFDHRLRPDVEVETERAVVSDTSEALRVPVVFGAGAAPATGGEAGARAARYQWLAEICRDAEARTCVTGHTMDDQAETVLLRLVRGSGLPGASAMAEVSPWPLPDAAPVHPGGAGALRLVRPLLACARAEVLDYLDALGLEAREDPSNELVTFDRNRIRHRVLPELRRLNPRAARRIAAFAELARADDEALQAWATQVLTAHASQRGSAVYIERAVLRALPEAVASRVVRQAGERVGLRLDLAQTVQVLACLGRRGARTSLADGHARTDEVELVIERDRTSRPP